MITIEQLLESVDLNFEPRWIAKDGNGDVYIFEDAPETCEQSKEWVTTVFASGLAGYEGLKLAEFENKPWQECIYEVLRKTTGKIEKFDSSAIDTLYDSNSEKFKKFICGEIVCKLNEVIDAVNELKGAKNE